MEWLPQLAVYGSYDSLYLSHSEHTSEERVSCVVASGLVAEHCHSMVNTHREMLDNGIFGSSHLFRFEDSCLFDDVGASTEMACFGEIAVVENVA